MPRRWAALPGPDGVTPVRHEEARVHPVLFRIDLPVIGELTISTFGVMVALAFAAAAWTLTVRLREQGRDPSLAGDIVVAAALGGLLGGKLYYVVLNLGQTLADPLGMLFSRSGLVWYGGLAGGALAVIWWARRRGLRIPQTADLVAPALALGYGIGRIGCFLVGDDYGRPTDSWMGVRFPLGSPPSTAENLRVLFGVPVPPGVAPDTVLPVWPTQLFESAAGLAMFAILWRLRRRPARSGWLFGVWMVLAGSERFLIEFLRAKDDRFFGPFTLAQVISAVLVVAGLAVVRLRRGPEAA